MIRFQYIILLTIVTIILKLLLVYSKYLLEQMQMT